MKYKGAVTKVLSPLSEIPAYRSRLSKMDCMGILRAIEKLYALLIVVGFRAM